MLDLGSSLPPPLPSLPFFLLHPLFLSPPFFHPQWYKHRHQNHSGKPKQSCAPLVCLSTALVEITVEFSMTLCGICISLRLQGPELFLCTQRKEVEEDINTCLFIKQNNNFVDYFATVTYLFLFYSKLCYSILLYSIVIWELFKCCLCSS